MTKFADWLALQCRCGHGVFHEVKRLRWSQSGGTVAEPAGWKCESCGADADSGKMIQDLKLRQAKAEVAARQKEIAESEPTPSRSSNE